MHFRVETEGREIVLQATTNGNSVSIQNYQSSETQTGRSPLEPPSWIQDYFRDSLRERCADFVRLAMVEGTDGVRLMSPSLPIPTEDLNQPAGAGAEHDEQLTVETVAQASGIPSPCPTEPGETVPPEIEQEGTGTAISGGDVGVPNPQESNAQYEDPMSPDWTGNQSSPMLDTMD